MEALAQFEIPLTRRVRRYDRNTRRDIIEDVYHNKITEVIYYRCAHCGKYKSASKTRVCDKCEVQLEMFV